MDGDLKGKRIKSEICALLNFRLVCVEYDEVATLATLGISSLKLYPQEVPSEHAERGV